VWSWSEPLLTHRDVNRGTIPYSARSGVAGILPSYAEPAPEGKRPIARNEL
jgi:hypothetical protein